MCSSRDTSGYTCCSREIKLPGGLSCASKFKLVPVFAHAPWVKIPYCDEDFAALKGFAYIPGHSILELEYNITVIEHKWVFALKRYGLARVAAGWHGKDKNVFPILGGHVDDVVLV